ncbi:hypothetical protein [Peribacillus deserti]|uniref:Uncharacterized protein n=1 Tax=Peribacillus deserti TaxID=673318 RepID=A0A2N5M4T2_9BACI|nr:hypothetical protein [Peribacillus deserti]PLT29376.1 hypothetical protein CUU66_13190 [Peribacillus deserti]
MASRNNLRNLGDLSNLGNLRNLGDLSNLGDLRNLGDLSNLRNLGNRNINRTQLRRVINRLRAFKREVKRDTRSLVRDLRRIVK